MSIYKTPLGQEKSVKKTKKAVYREFWEMTSTDFHHSIELMA